MAQGAGIQLQVGLDLAYFRSQLASLGTAAAGYRLPITVQFKPKSIQDELKKLNKINATIRINDSQVDAARSRLGTLNKSLATLRRATATPIEIKVKYVEVGKPSAAAGQIGRAVSGGVRGSQALEGASRGELLNIRKMMSEAGMALGKIANLSKATANELRTSIIPAFTNSGEEAINGLAAGLADSSSKIGKIAAKVGIEAVNGIKTALGIASPSRVFKQIGEFSVDGLELGFLDGLKDFKSKSVAEIRKIVALLKFELAKVSDLSGMGGPSMGSLRQRLVGQRAYTSPIGPLPLGSRAPWAASGSGYEPRMVSRPYGQAYPAAPSSFLAFSRQAGQVPPSNRTPGSFLEFSQRASQISRASAAGGPPRPPSGRGSFPSDGMLATSPQRMGVALDVASRSMKNFRASQLPLVGGLKEIGGEFFQATKQVLLYGTAYKGLAFITGLPGQILNAAKSQQQYNNALKTATQDTGTYGKELLYIDNVQRAFGLDLETTRSSFVRLYASMAPTGFDSGSIEKLFTGISAATAALQLTPDKAERVIYAFGQMASKGQIMSEELKGQLGDVLPGALAIFSNAAGMSVQKFSKAMEDGEFIGDRFRELFAKVSDELMNRFGTGAQAAGKSMQGLINVVGGDFKRTLESFAPLANSAAQAILGPLGGSLKQLSMSAQIATGEIERSFMQLQQAQKDLGELKATPGVDAKEIQAAEQNVAALTVRYEALTKAAQDPAINKQAQDIQKFTEELTKAGTFVLNLANNIGSVLSPILNFFGSNLTTTISLVTALYLGFQAMRLATLAVMGALLLLKTVSAALGLGQAAMSANALSGAFALLGIQASGASIKVIGLTTALRVLAGATIIGAVVGGITLIAGAFATMRDRAKEASEASRDAAKSAIEAASTGSVAQASMAVQNILAEGRADAAALRTLQGIRARATKEQKAGVAPLGLTIEEAVALQGSKLTAGIVTGGVTRGGRREIRVPSGQEMTGLETQFGRVAGERKVALGEAKTAETQAAETAKRLGLNKPGAVTPATGTEDGTAGEAGGGAKPAKERESQIPQLMLRLEKTRELAALDLQITNATLTNNTAQISSLELAKQLVEFKYEAKELDLQDLTTAEKAIAKREIALQTEQAILASQLQLQIELRKERDSIQQGFSKILEGYEEESGYQQMYLKLIDQGIRPALAKARVEVEKSFREQEKQLDASIALNKENIAATEITIEQFKLQKNLSEESKKQLADAERRLEILKEELGLREGIKAGVPDAKGRATEEAEKGLMPKTPGEYITEGLEAAEDKLKELTNAGYQVVEAANAIGDAFGTAFKGVLTGSMTVREALAGFFQSVADSFADMVAKMIAEWLRAQLIRGFQSLFSWASSFATPLKFANGGIAPRGFQAFASGGIVTGPTLGLVGEGRYNEAVIPLPDGKSVPVDLGGAMGSQITSNIVVNVSSDGKTSSSGAGSDSAGLGRKLEGAVKQVIVDELRPGGLLSGRR